MLFLDYLTRLRNVQEKIADKVLIVPRVYTNKPRTTGEGYKGMVHQPDPEKQPNLLAGLVAIRKNAYPCNPDQWYDLCR